MQKFSEVLQTIGPLGSPYSLAETTLGLTLRTPKATTGGRLSSLSLSFWSLWEETFIS
jgi:hypothetical protein